MKLITLAVMLASLAAGLTVAGCKKEPVPKPVAAPAEKQADPADEALAAEAPADDDAADELPVAPTAPQEAPVGGARTQVPWDAKIGTMVKLKSADGGTNTMEVIKVDGETITMRMTLEAPGLEEPAVSEVEMQRSVPASWLPGTSDGLGRRVGKETLQVAGKALECEVWQATVDDDGQAVTTRTYINRSVPGWAVRVDSDMQGEMQTVVEVVDFRS